MSEQLLVKLRSVSLRCPILNKVVKIKPPEVSVESETSGGGEYRARSLGWIEVTCACGQVHRVSLKQT